MISYWFSKRKQGTINDPVIMQALYVRIWKRRKQEEEALGLTRAGLGKTLRCGVTSPASYAETQLKD